MAQSLRIPQRVRCLAWQTEGQWVVSTLEFGLAAQADTYEQAKEKIEAQINDFVRVALREDPDFRRELFARRAVWHDYARWYVARAMQPVHAAGDGLRAFFEETPRLSVAA